MSTASQADRGEDRGATADGPDRRSATITRLDLSANGFGFSALSAGPRAGVPVLMLHGFPEFADSWTAELLALGGAGYHAVAFDQRGYSVAARPDGVDYYAVDHLVSDVLAIADALGMRRFHLVAHDWGGMVAWSLAAAHADRLRSLTVLATPHPAALAQAMAADSDQFHRLDYIRFFRRPGHLAEESLLADNAARLRAAYGGHLPRHLVDENVRRLSVDGALTAALNWYRALNEDLTVPVARIAVPTLYVWGTEDVALGRQAAERTVDFVDGPYSFQVLDGVSHWIPEQVPDTVIPLIERHLSTADTR
jgi:pimeloyl-ACP methyl ester carboxylesterase